MSKPDAAFAAQRFGLGPKPGDLARIGNDPRSWLLSQITADPPRPAAFASLLPVTERIAALAAFRQAQRLTKQNNAAGTANSADNKAVKGEKPADGAGANLRQMYIDMSPHAVLPRSPAMRRWSNAWSSSGRTISPSPPSGRWWRRLR